MKRSTLLLGAALVVLAACSPETFTMNIEMRYPSKSGLDLFGKSMSVVYADDGAVSDTAFLRSVASGFARKMEKEYFGGQEVIRLFHVPGDTAAVTGSAFMQDLVMDTGDDVVFYFSSLECGAVGNLENIPSGLNAGLDSTYCCSVTLPFKLKLSAYDSMAKDDKVLHFHGSSSVHPYVYNDGNATHGDLVGRAWEIAASQAEVVGTQSCGKFLSTWVAEGYTFYYYTSLDDSWDLASQAAYEFRWADAISQWTKLVQNYPRGGFRRACAEYNLASAFYILGKYDLASRWLACADSDATLTLSPGLHKRIASRTK